MHFLTNLVAWILFGALAGWITAQLMHLRTSFWANCFIGIIGAVLGGAIVTLIGGNGITGFNIYSLLVAVAGACLFTWVLRRSGAKGVTK
ncbi:MAG TPA: GlsB/YeaQ/YmgE family stress response membrane protein [Candidatus Saccharimonadales bacterium]|nr:GlsB/YeaQ/YmgE family stress response membrane protein [Candidatus Saccharimonadales bacterium]